MNVTTCKRIMIFGRPGSGKSTFATRLSKEISIPAHHLDRHFYVENWQERENAEFLAIQKELVEQESWIIDGNSIRSLELRYAKADLVLYLHFNRFLCIWRTLKRRLQKKRTIEDRAEGCKETLSLKLIRYLWNFDKRVSEPLKTLRSKYPKPPFYEIHNDKELARIF